MSERRVPLTKKQRRYWANRSRCRDCSVDVIEIGHYCMVSDELWAATGLGPHDGMLCLEHIERRIGRRLKPEDFTAVFPRGWLVFIASRGLYVPPPSSRRTNHAGAAIGDLFA